MKIYSLPIISANSLCIYLSLLRFELRVLYFALPVMASLTIHFIYVQDRKLCTVLFIFLYVYSSVIA